jgi:hypothetical protein
MHTTIPGVAERLIGDFGASLEAAQITEILGDCVRDLRGQAPEPALPELTERLARARLTQLTQAPPVDHPG